MSVVFCLLKKEYAIIATDTRIMLKDSSECKYTDDYDKIYQGQFGWVSGVGVGELIRNMIDKINDSIDESFYEEIIKLSSRYDIEQLKKTIICFSNINSNLKPEIYYIGSVYSLTQVQENRLMGMSPSDIKEEKWEKLFQKYSSLLNNANLSLENVIKIIANLIYEVSQNCCTVSEILDIGILTKDGTIRIRRKCIEIIEK